MNWKSCKQEPPPLRQIVLCFRKGWTMPTTASRNITKQGEHWYMRGLSKFLSTSDAPDVWMELPQPPAELVTKID